MKKVYLIYDVCDNFEEEETNSYLLEVCSSIDIAKRVREQIAEDLAVKNSMVENCTTYIEPDSDGNPTVTIRRGKCTISEDHLTIEEWTLR